MSVHLIEGMLIDEAKVSKNTETNRGQCQCFSYFVDIQVPTLGKVMLSLCYYKDTHRSNRRFERGTFTYVL